MARLVALPPDTVDVRGAIAGARLAQADWNATSVSERLAVVRRFRHLLVERAEWVVSTLELPHRTSTVESLTSEVLPLADQRADESRPVDDQGKDGEAEPERGGTALPQRIALGLRAQRHAAPMVGVLSVAATHGSGSRSRRRSYPVLPLWGAVPRAAMP